MQGRFYFKGKTSQPKDLIKKYQVNKNSESLWTLN